MVLCRICAKDVPPLDIAQELFEPDERQLLHQIEELTGIMLENTKNKPQSICAQCHNDLLHAHEFRIRCIETQEYFNSTTYTRICENETETDTETNELEEKHNDLSMDDTDLAIYFPVKEEEEGEFDDELVASDLKEEQQQLCEASIDNLSDNANFEQDALLTDDEMPLKQRKMKAKKKRSVKEKKQEAKKEKKLPTLRVANLPLEPRGDDLYKLGSDYICDQCGNKFKGRNTFRTHLKRHSGDKQYHCEICTDKFFTPSELKRHMRRHTGERPFACKHCHRRFTDYSTRIKHERTHTNERPFACNQCGKAFTTGYILKNHMLMHTGERSFRCEICNRNFQRQSHLVVHNRSLIHQHHLEKQQRINNVLIDDQTETLKQLISPVK